MYPPPIENLIKQFSKFPTVGPRTAARFVFYLLRAPEEEVKKIIEGISNLKKEVKLCSFCFKPYTGKGNLCEICYDTTRDRTKICVVEKEMDLEAIEKTKKYNGLYFILGGTIPLLKKEPKKIRINELIERIKDPVIFHLFNASIQEIIIATNPTPEGDATANYLEKKLKPFNVRITKLGRGLPIGGELEYADEETLSEALERRK
ncbi:recombination protein RecR [bacterium]|nr:recombination protein RecR [bacterium]